MGYSTSVRILGVVFVAVVLSVGGVSFVMSHAWLAADNAANPDNKEEPDGVDEQLLKDIGVGTEDAKVLAYLRERSPSDEDLADIEGVMRKLGSSEFSVREAAARKVVNLGLPALPALRKACKDDDKEIARRAKDCLAAIDVESHRSVPLAAVRRLLKRQPEGLTAVFVQYLPFAVDEAVEEAIYFGLDGVADLTKKVDAALVAALKDKLPARRALAACIVGSRGTEEQRKAVRNLLRDDDATVRLRAAQGLLAARDREAVPVLIALLEEPSVAVSWQAEELLHWLAGDDGPDEIVGAATKASRNACMAAWKAWWSGAGGKLDLTKLDREDRRPRLLFLQLGLSPNNPFPTGVGICGSDGKTRWQIQKLRHVQSAQILPNNIALLGEFGLLKSWVTERDLEGNILREQEEGVQLISCEGLPNGNLLIASAWSIRETDRVGNQQYLHEVFTGDLPIPTGFHGIQAICRLPDGHLFCASRELYHVYEIDAVGNVQGIRDQGLDQLVKVRRLEVEKLQPALKDRPTNFTLAPQSTGHLITFLSVTRLFGEEKGEIVDLDQLGRVAWRSRILGSCEGPIVPAGNGDYLVSCGYGSGKWVIEIDNTGRPLFQIFPDGYLMGSCFRLVGVGFSNPKPPDLDAQALARLLKDLRSRNVTKRRKAAANLRALGEVTKPALAELVEALADDDKEVRLQTQGTLTAHGMAAMPYWLKALQHKDGRIRLAALTGFYPEMRRPPGFRYERCPCPPEALPLFVGLMKDPDPEIRWIAVASVGCFEPKAKDAVPALIRITEDQGEAVVVRERAIDALVLIAPLDENVLNSLKKAAKDRTVELQAKAALKRLSEQK